ncbi:hypothetical protein C3747_91g308c [Trypanosoma cruzi]|uniref:Uncharacterized protein n=2 Tax=Trypanosoma cruzi TaxID=5693 RepID=Q4E110_TRYCC|nr:hypothetical protein, conserved [Trypanosoma cruzi]EAN98507.1 hypothetical protein, conserved [Trypanosoma cruzi]PWV08334.1 hypothetical protein C3747_91g308c [Trypanosoma cruzi]RNC45868.1 hypothetical protein TcCL_NonESM04293 [Trypanosoma cruzi]|eukprot:XP_820358.1 hypothetical protein [Trypanosoma cruzi strain CL Brener]
MRNRPEVRSKPREWYYYGGKLLSILALSCVVKFSRLVEVMLRSRKIIQPAMWVSYLCYVVFFALWIYTSCFVQPRHPNWSETHKYLIYSATCAVTAGGVLWTIAVWPVFHIWTIPLGMVVLVLFLEVVAIIPWNSRKMKH